MLELTAVSRQYGALRPLRIENLHVAPAEQIALVGLDQPAAEAFINLITGATLPDAGTVRVFSQTTTDIAGDTHWLALLDRFGIVSARAVLLESLSVVQNLAMPFSLEIEPPPHETRHRAIALAREVGLAEDTWDTPVSGLSGLDKVRVRLARALALGPSLVVLEHPSARLARGDVRLLGRQLSAVVGARGLASILLTMDQELVEAAGVRTLVLDPATGRLRDSRRGGGLGRIAFWK